MGMMEWTDGLDMVHSQIPFRAREHTCSLRQIGWSTFCMPFARKGWKYEYPLPSTPSCSFQCLVGGCIVPPDARPAISTMALQKHEFPKRHRNP